MVYITQVTGWSLATPEAMTMAREGGGGKLRDINSTSVNLTFQLMIQSIIKHQ